MTASKGVSFLPISSFNIIGHFSQGIFQHLDEIAAAASQAAQTRDSLALGVIIGHRKDFAVRPETMSGSLD